MRPILALGFLLLGLNSAAPEPKHSNTVLAAADTPSAEPIAIDRLIGSIDVKSDVVVPSLEVIEASHEQQDSIAEPQTGEAGSARRTGAFSGTSRQDCLLRQQSKEG